MGRCLFGVLVSVSVLDWMALRVIGLDWVGLGWVEGD